MKTTAKPRLVRSTSTNTNSSPFSTTYSPSPTLLVFKGGQVAEQKVGVASKGDLQAMLDSHA